LRHPCHLPSPPPPRPPRASHLNDFAAWMAGSTTVVGSLLDLCLYPALFAQYAADTWLGGADKLSFLAQAGLRAAVLLSAGAVNAFGVSASAAVSAAITVAVFAPFLISLFAQLPAVRVRRGEGGGSCVCSR
jgi:hypothetical protein